MRTHRYLYASVLVVAIMMISILSLAAEYNLFFNNIEQGDHSTAQSSVEVDGKRVNKKKKLGENNPEQVLSTELQEKAEVAERVEEGIPVKEDHEGVPRKDRWRLSVLAGAVIQDHSREWERKPKGIELGIDYRFNPHLGVRVSGGAMSFASRSKKFERNDLRAFGTATFEAIPVAMDLFGVRRMIELGVGGGVGYLPHGASKKVETSWLPLAAARTTVHLADPLALSASFVLTPKTQSVFAGLQFRF